MGDQKNRTLGMVLVVIGGFLILNYYHIVHFNIWDLWPLILIYIGAKSENDYFSGRSNSRSLLTGAVFITYGLLFLASSFLSWRISGKLWPLYIMGPALGFLQMAYYGHRQKKNFKTGIILMGISSAMLIDNFINLRFDLIIYVALIAIGLFMLRKDSEIEDDYEDYEGDDDKDKDRRY